MITLFLFACVWICTVKSVKLSAPMTYLFFAFIILTAIFRINAVYLLPLAAIYAALTVYAIFMPWQESEFHNARNNIKRWVKHPAELFGYRIIAPFVYIVPLPALSWFGGTLLEMVGPNIKRRQNIMKKNLDMTLPDCANEKFMKHVWNNWGRVFAEGLKFTTYKNKMDKYITFRNKNMLYTHPQFLLAMPHFGNMGLMALAFVNSGLKIGVTYKQARNPLTNDVVLRTYGYGKVNETHFIPVGNAIPMVRALRDGEILNINSDQRFHGAPEIDFMGIPAPTSTGLSQLARKFNLPILVGHVERTNGAKHEIVLDEFINVPHTDDATADELNGMKLVNESMARIIKQKPEEYLWMHKRWRK